MFVFWFELDWECECDFDLDLDFEGDFKGECECVAELGPEDGREGVDGAVHPPTEGLVALVVVEVGYVFVYGYDVERLRDV